jgi:hypothetical protein
MSYHRTDTLSPFPQRRIMNSESIDLIFEEGKVAGPKPLTIVLVSYTLARMKILNRFIHEMKG